MSRHRMAAGMALAACLAGAGLTADAQKLDGTKQVVLSNAQGERVVIGSVRFTQEGDARWRFALELDPQKFGEYFLAMRPFKCLPGPRQFLCHFPYGEEQVITREDLQPLEYALMFMHKKPAVLHLDSRDGVYYKLQWTERGFAGNLYDVDMDPIIVPQGDRRRPIRAEHLIKADEGSHWLPRLAIE